MHKLDDQNIYAALDPSRLGARIAALPGQCGEAWQQISQAELPVFPQPQNQVVDQALLTKLKTVVAHVDHQCGFQQIPLDSVNVSYS